MRAPLSFSVNFKDSVKFFQEVAKKIGNIEWRKQLPGLARRAFRQQWAASCPAWFN
jgi:hypothetical protein